MLEKQKLGNLLLEMYQKLQTCLFSIFTREVSPKKQNPWSFLVVVNERWTKNTLKSRVVLQVSPDLEFADKIRSLREL